MTPLDLNTVSLLRADAPSEGPGLELQSVPGGAVHGGGLAGEFDRLLQAARQRDVVAQRAVESFARNEEPGRIHEVMVAVSKAEITLRTVVSVRNKLIDAYRDLQHVVA